MLRVSDLQVSGKRERPQQSPGNAKTPAPALRDSACGEQCRFFLKLPDSGDEGDDVPTPETIRAFNIEDLCIDEDLASPLRPPDAPSPIKRQPGLGRLQHSEVPEERELMALFQRWWGALYVVLLIVRNPNADKYVDILRQWVKQLHTAMKQLSDAILPIAPGQYEHITFRHLADDIERFGALIPWACYLTEHTNSEAKEVDAHHTSHGGGHPTKDGSTEHMCPAGQALARMLVLHSGLLERVCARYGAGVQWLQTKVNSAVTS